MKLSDLIILGSMQSGQAFGVIIDDEGNTCANGAALLALGVPAEDLQNGMQWKHPKSRPFFEWQKVNVAHPFTGVLTGLLSVVIELNNIHRWPRAKIAEWVSTVEPQEVPTDITSSPKENTVCVS